MRLLVDTHAILWAVDSPSQIGASAVIALRDLKNERLVSATSLWEIAIKLGLGKLRLSTAFLDWTLKAVNQLDSHTLPIRPDHLDVYAQLPFHHRDPFDRILIAQAIVENASVVSSDQAFDMYGVSRVWN